MKLRNFVLCLLIVFCFSLLLTAQVTVNTSTDTPLEKAKDAHTEAAHAYLLAKEVSDKAYTDYMSSRLARIHLETAYDIAVSKDEDEFNILKGKISSFLDAVGLDPVDIITDVASIILKDIESGLWDHISISKKKSDIEKALSDQSKNVRKYYNEWQDKVRKKYEALDKKQEAYDAWQELKAVLYTFGPKHGEYSTYAGESHTSFLSLSKRWSNVKWYLKFPSQTGQGRLARNYSDNTDKSKTSEFTYPYSVTGKYIITVKAEMESTDEVVENKYTLTVLPTGITYNKYSFNSDETLIIIVERDNISSASMYINGEIKDSRLANLESKVVLSYDISRLFIVNEQKYAYANVSIHITSTNPDKSVTVHNNYIWAEKVNYNASITTSPDRPKSFSLEKGWSKGQIRLKWTKPDSDEGSKITDYEYQYSFWSDIANNWTKWPSGWDSAGTDMTELISGLRSKTKYRVRMRAVSGNVPSVNTGYRTVITR